MERMRSAPRAGRLLALQALSLGPTAMLRIVLSKISLVSNIAFKAIFPIMGVDRFAGDERWPA
jgi:hypothetical protein